MLNKYSIIIYLIIFLYSCTKEVKIDLPKPETKLVVNSLFTPDSLFTVMISKNIDILKDENPLINNAKVELYADNQLLEVLKNTSNGFYQSLTNKPKHNINYKVIVSATGFNQVSAYDILPSPVKIIETSLTKNAGCDEEGNKMSSISIKFKDNPKEKNYYKIKVDGFILRSNDPVIKCEGDLDYYPCYLLFKDNLFDGKEYCLNVKFIIPSSNEYNIIIYLSSLSENYYHYQKKLIRHIYNQTPDIWDGSGEPVNMYTNVDNGYGIFAGYCVDSDTIKDVIY